MACYRKQTTVLHSLSSRRGVLDWRGLQPSPTGTGLVPSWRPEGPAVSSPGRKAGERGHPPRKRSGGPAHTPMNVSVLRTSFIHVAADSDLTVGATDCRPFGPRERRKTVFRPIRAKHLRRDGQRTGPRLLPFDHRLSRPFFGAVGLLSWGLLGPLGLHAMQPVLTLMRNRGQSAVFRVVGVFAATGAP